MSHFVDADKLHYKRIYVAQPDDSAKDAVVVFAKELDKAKERTRISPCDVCMFNPPSSIDGKPCTMCPAVPVE